MATNPKNARPAVDSFTAKTKGRQGKAENTVAREAKCAELRGQANGDGKLVIVLSTDFPSDNITTVRNTLRAMAEAKGEKASITASTTSDDQFLVTWSKAKVKATA